MVLQRTFQISILFAGAGKKWLLTSMTLKLQATFPCTLAFYMITWFQKEVIEDVRASRSLVRATRARKLANPQAIGIRHELGDVLGLILSDCSRFSGNTGPMVSEENLMQN